MNPEAVAWLEGLDERAHLGRFKPPAGEPGKLYSMKPDHEPCGLCPQAIRYDRLTVID